MSRDYKLNTSEFSRLKRQEKLYGHYLPVMRLKLEQLQREHHRVSQALVVALAQKSARLNELSPFIKLLADPSGISILDLVHIEEIQTRDKSIAGVVVKVFEALQFKPVSIPLFQTAPWLVRVMPLLQRFLEAEAHECMLAREREIIRRELKKASHKVNLFDVVLMPRTLDAIKDITIALGDEHVASVSRSKIAKKKMSLGAMLSV